MSTNTHPRGAVLPPLNPTQVTLGLTNASFVAQTIDWNPLHLYSTLLAAYEHQGLSFVRILQRCPTYSDHVFEQLQSDPSMITLLEHENGIPIDPALRRVFVNSMTHDPGDMKTARELAGRTDTVPVGLFYYDPTRPQYDQYTAQGLDVNADEKVRAINEELERFAM
jgi:2-oxoglutarate ferredoxin oxidoreductase subunit beta